MGYFVQTPCCIGLYERDIKKNCRNYSSLKMLRFGNVGYPRVLLIVGPYKYPKLGFKVFA